MCILQVILEIEAHIRATEEVRCGEIKTNIVNTVNECLADPSS